MSIMKITVATVVVLGAVGATTAFYLNTRSHDEAAPENPGQKIVAAAGPVSASGPGADDIRTLQQENERLRRIINALEGSDGDGVREKIARLRSMLERLPEQRIPEFELLTEDDWYAAVDGPLESVEDYRVALSKLRGRAETRFAAEVQPALRTFLTAHGDKFPNTVAELKPFLERSLGDAMLGRYRIVGAADIPNVKMGGDWIITQTTLVDSTYDSRVVIGPKGHGSTNRKPQEAAILEPVMKAFAEANAGVAPQHPAQLLPFATTPEQKAALERLSRSSPRRPEGKSTLPAGSK